ncbi:MAG: hypothetical protein HYY06_26455 [Deltaproteobacteria bacterium]|nr:hypothetical protein [Deltaproteobacteria bacterium]
MSAVAPVEQGAAVGRAAAASRELRRARARRLAWAFSILVAGPTLFAAVYYGWIATPEYESIAVLAVDGGEPAEQAQHAGKKGGLPDSALQALRAHLLSRQTSAKLAVEDGLVRHYQHPRIDWLSRLARGAGSEKAHEYYLSKVTVVGDAAGGTLTVGVRAFSARRAQGFARWLVAAAERFVERMSERARRDLEASATSGLDAARDRLARALSAQTRPADLELELARDQMQSAQRAAEMARIEAARRHRHLVVVAEPSLPGEASYPRKGWSVATVFFGALVAAMVLWLLVAAVREHAQL